MKKHNIYTCILLFIILSLFLQSLNAKTDIMPLSKIQSGMKGYGLSVFKGIKIEKFNVEIIGVLHKSRPRSGLILAKIKGDVVNKAGVIAGMSGSPIYINNKLIGALAFSWTFSKEPIAGITPIEDMLDIFKFPSTKKTLHFEPSPQKKYAHQKINNSSMELIQTPLIFQGVSQQMIDYFTKDLEELNFMPINGSSDGTAYESPKEFKPGAAVGVNLITGDLNVSGIGTVTYVDKNRLLIFGHPMFYSGQTDMPLSHAYIHTVLPSIRTSFKIGSATKIAGRIYQDQLAGLAGNLNEKAKMIPVHISMDYFNQKERYNYNLIRSYFFLPQFLTMAVYRSMEMTGGYWEKNTLDFNFTIKFNNNKKINLANSFSSLRTADSMKGSLMYLFGPLQHLMINKFQEISIDDINIDIKIKKKITIAEINSIQAIKKTYTPGETVKLKVKMTPYKGKSIYKSVSIKLPYNINLPKITLFVTGDQERQFIDYILSPHKYRPHSLEQLIELYNGLAKSTDLAIWTFLKDKSIIAQGDRMENLPASYYSILQNSLESGTHKALFQIKDKIPTKYIIQGSAAISLDIKKDLQYKTKP